jgi:hypothetical protein
MATESSAVVRFINLAQQTQNPVLPTPTAPITSEFGTEVLRTVTTQRKSRVPLVVGAIALAGAAAGAGVYLGKSGFGSSGPDKDSPSQGATPAAAAAPVAAADRADEPARPEAPAPAAAQPASGPQVTSPVVSVPPDVLATTGYDIRVEPGATVTLDGTVLGKAPLRVRNLQPGAHVLDLEAPAGYFSRRMEIAVAAGEAKELKVSLDPIEEDPAVAAATADDSRSSGKSAKRSRADLKRERKEKAREERQRQKEMRATRVAASKAAREAAKSHKADARASVVAEPLPEADSKPAKSATSDKESQADADLEAAMADIVGKPSRKKSAAAAAGASSLAPAPAASSSGKGTLMLGSKPPCDIMIDGKLTGLKTPQRSMELSAGTHQVVLVNADLGIEKKFKVRIAPGKTTKAIQDLTSKLD